MENLKYFSEYINEADGYEQPDAEERIKEIRKRVYAQSPEERLSQVAYDESGALGRLMGDVAEGLAGLKNGVSKLFRSPNASNMSNSDLKRDKKEVLSKWGEGIKKRRRNRPGDYEDFYRDAIITGKRSFGRKFDIEHPRGEEEEIFVDYVNDASRYFDFRRR